MAAAEDQTGTRFFFTSLSCKVLTREVEKGERSLPVFSAPPRLWDGVTPGPCRVSATNLE